MAYLVSHPIQYQAPLLRRISAEPDIDLTVFFCSDLSVREYRDEGFGASVQWDVPLLDGYRHEFLPALGRTDRLSFWRPLSYGLARRLSKGNYDALWIHGWGYWSHLSAVSSAKRRGIKVLMRGEAGSHLLPGSPFRKAVKNLLLRWLFARVDAFLAIGTPNREFYTTHGIDAGRIFSVPYAVDNLFFQGRASLAAQRRSAFRESLGLQPGRPVILYAGKLMPRKRPADLLEAYVQLSPDGRSEPAAYLLFVGDGELREALDRRVEQLGWKSIRMLGFKNQTELPAFYDLCDVFVIPSEQEPWGLVVNEVMNAGRAVIASDEVGCAADLVQDGENGFIYRVGDVAALTKRLKHILPDVPVSREMGNLSLAKVRRWDFEADIAGLKMALEAVAG